MISISCESLEVGRPVLICLCFTKSSGTRPSSPLLHHVQVQPLCSGVNSSIFFQAAEGGKKLEEEAKRNNVSQKLPRTILPFLSHWLKLCHMAIPSWEGMSCKGGRYTVGHQFCNTYFSYFSISLIEILNHLPELKNKICLTLIVVLVFS